MKDWMRVHEPDQRRDMPVAQARRIAPAKVTRTSQLDRDPSRVVQRKGPVAAAQGPALQRRTAWEQTMDPWMDAAHRGLSAPAQASEDAAAADARPVAASGGGSPMPVAVQAKMEHAFGVDFSGVRIHEGPQARAVGALAYTQGTDIHMAPGQYDPHGQRGQELLGHELAHVVQQAHGRVEATTQAKGVDINDDPGLEHEADVMGARAARGERIAGAPAGQPLRIGGAGSGAGSAAISRKAVIQRVIDDADLPVIEGMGKRLEEDESTEATKVTGCLVAEQNGNRLERELPVFDNAYAQRAGKYTTAAHHKDPKKGHDAEAKLLDLAALYLEDWLKAGTITRATLHLRGNRGPCNRCRGQIGVFQQDYPFVEVKSLYEQETSVENSNIENDTGKETYKNGYPSAVKARIAYRGQKNVTDILGDNLWYQHLQSANDKANQIDPQEQKRQEMALARVKEKRALFITNARALEDKIFRAQTRDVQVKERHALESAQKRGRETRNRYVDKVKPKLPDDTGVKAIHRDLSIAWNLNGDGYEGRWTAAVTYPSIGVYEKHHEAVAQSLKSYAPGFTYDKVTQTCPNPDETREAFGKAFGAYLDAVQRGDHDQDLRYFVDKIEMNSLPRFVS
jgi:Domain of unknown function (DUF4157)